MHSTNLAALVIWLERESEKTENNLHRRLSSQLGAQGQIDSSIRKLKPAYIHHRNRVAKIVMFNTAVNKYKRGTAL